MRILGFFASAWVLYTLYMVLRFGGAVVVDPDTTSRIMGVRNDAVITSAIGLTYHGLAGAVLVVTEALAVLAALAAAWFGSGLKRVVGLWLLVGWGALWFGNALWLRAHGWQHGLDTIGMGVGMLLTLGWAIGVTRQSRT